MRRRRAIRPRATGPSSWHPRARACGGVPGGRAGRKRRRGARAAGRVPSRLRRGGRGAHVAPGREARSGQELRQGLHARRDPVHQLGQARPGVRGRRHRSLGRQRERGHFRRRRGREGNVHRLDFARELARLQHRLLRQGEFADPIGDRSQRQDRRHQRLFHVRPSLAEGRARQAWACRDRRQDHARAVLRDAGIARRRQDRHRAVPAAICRLGGKTDEGAKDLRCQIWDTVRGGADRSGRQGRLPEEECGGHPRDAARPDGSRCSSISNARAKPGSF